MAVSNMAWSRFSQADYSLEQWRRACLIDTGQGDPDSKDRYKLPVREPDGTLNRNGVHAAAGGPGVGAVTGVTPDKKRAAARKLVGLYRNELNEEPPASLLRLAGMAERGGLVAELERRFTPGLVEVRAEGDTGRIGGYAAVFNKLSRNLGGFVEAVRSGAFNGSRAAGWPNVVARYNHDNNALLGTIAGRTLDLRVDDGTGLWYEVMPPQSRQDIMDLVRRGDIRHSSFAFRAMPGGDHWTTSDQGYPLRELNEVQLFDVAPVVDPAYPDATAQSRALAGALASLADQVQVAVEEVRSMAAADELRRFFVRTDTPSTKTPARRTFGPAAAAALLARRQDPWA